MMPKLVIVTRILFVVTLALAACKLTEGQKVVANTVLDVASYACIIANAESSDETLQKACQLANDLLPVAKKVIKDYTAKRDGYAAVKVKEYAVAHTSACPPLALDAGAR